ncbi:hypothetical protein [Methylocystis sp. S23]|jgi:hypothetical protein
MQLDTAQNLFFWSSVLVFLGVALEGQEIWAELEEGNFSIRNVKNILAKIGFMLLVVGLSGEILSENEIERAEKLLSDSADKEIIAAKNQAEVALQSAIRAEKEAARLLSENVELEKALEPRSVNQISIAKSVLYLTRVPVFVVSSGQEEPRGIANQIAISFNFVKFGFVEKQEFWSVKQMPFDSSIGDGITIQYVDSFGSWSAAKDVSLALCDSLKSSGLTVRTDPISVLSLDKAWEEKYPFEAVVILVGAKPNNFWLNKRLEREGGERLSETSWCSR